MTCDIRVGDARDSGRPYISLRSPHRLLFTHFFQIDAEATRSYVKEVRRKWVGRTWFGELEEVEVVCKMRHLIKECQGRYIPLTSFVTTVPSSSTRWQQLDVRTVRLRIVHLMIVCFLNYSMFYMSNRDYLQKRLSFRYFQIITRSQFMKAFPSTHKCRVILHEQLMWMKNVSFFVIICCWEIDSKTVEYSL